MAKLSKLEKRYVDLSNEIISLLVQGKGSSYANVDQIEFKPGTIVRMNELLSRRKEISDLIDDEDAGD